MPSGDVVIENASCFKGRILVHVHLYYHEMWSQLRNCLENLQGTHWDLCVTLVKHDTALEDKIKAFKPEVLMLTVLNRGFDVGPFLEALSHYDLSNYDFVLKLHSKRNVLPLTTVNGIVDVSGSRWRELLLSLVSSKDNFFKCINAFAQDPSLGMAGNYSLIQKVVKRGDFNSFVLRQASDLLKSLNLTPYPQESFCFVAGTMFMMRAEIAQKLKDLNLHCEDFEVPDRQKRDFDLAHVFEYLFGWLVSSLSNDEGVHYRIADPYTPRIKQQLDLRYWLSKHLYLKKMCRFIWRRTYCSKTQCIECRIFKLKIPFLSKFTGSKS